MTQEPILVKRQALLKKLLAYKAAYENNRIVFYKPLSGKDDRGEHVHFHADDEASVRIVFGSNRSSKSTAGVCEAIANSLGYRPWVPENHPSRVVRLCNGEPIPVPNIGRIVAPNFDVHIAQNIYPKFEEWAPRGWYKTKRSNRQVPLEITWSNGSKIYLLSNEQDDMAFEGTNHHWVWADEPLDYSKYVALKRGLIDFHGHMWLTQTPLTHPWTQEILVNRAGDPDGIVKFYKFSIWDNCDEYGGYLSRTEINKFLSDLREDELEARLHGNHISLAGRVFKEWSPEPPYWVEPFQIPRQWPKICVIDPHPRKPVAVLWVAMTPEGRLYVYRDLYDHSLVTIKDVARCIKDLEGHGTERDEEVVFRIIDNSANEHERTSGDTIRRRFMEEGLATQLAKKRNAQAGYDAIHEALKVSTEWAKPGLVVFNTCQHVKQNFMNFCYEEWATSKMREYKGDRQEYRKNHDDFIDCIRYIYQTTLGYSILKRELDRRAEEPDDPVPFGTNLFTGRMGVRDQWQTRSESSRSRRSRLHVMV